MDHDGGIRIKQSDGVLTLQFDRLQKKNAITSAMYQALADGLAHAEADDMVRVVLITGHPQVFTAGNDLEDFTKNLPLQADSPVFQFMHQMVHASKPVVACVAGAAVGIGTTLLSHCDLVYAADNAWFSLPFVQLGLCPEFGSSLLLQQGAGHRHAAQKLMLGEAFSVEEALRMGIVNQIVNAESLYDFAYAQALKLASLPASSLRMTKHLMKAGNRPALEASIAKENAAFGQLLETPEAREAIATFFQRKKPDGR